MFKERLPQGWLWTWVVCSWVLPAAGWAWHNSGVLAVLPVLIGQGLLLLLYQGATSIRLWPVRLLAYGVAALFVLLQIMAVVYCGVQGAALDPFFALDCLKEVFQTLVNSFGPLLVVTVTAAITVFWGLYCRVLSRLPRVIAWPKLYAPLGWIVPLVVVVAWWQISASSFFHAIMPFFQMNRLYGEKPGISAGGLVINTRAGVVTQQWGKIPSVGEAPVFIVQLESGNAMALQGLATPRSHKSAADLMPRLTAISQKGVMVPYMWGASMQTHRGQGAILCSAVLDVYAGISNSGDTPHQCLPQVLRAQGYNTVFMSAYANPYFSNTQNFMSKIGFVETHFADKMHPHDLRYRWGYDDCAFYDRYFDYLEKAYKGRLYRKFLGFFEVVANHDPFDRKPAYARFEPFAYPYTHAQNYLNSFAAQDHCLGRFMKRVDKYRDHAHVIIVADHSWPVGIHGGAHSSEQGAAPENFLIPFVYLPPRDRGDTFRHGVSITQPILGQADILPTLLELLTHKPFPNSFAALLKAPKPGEPDPVLPPDYDDCHVMTQPYDGTKISVVRGMEKFTYNRGSRKLRKTLLDKDFVESEVPVDDSGMTRPSMSYAAFLEKYLCARNQFWLGKSKDEPRAVSHYTATFVF